MNTLIISGLVLSIILLPIAIVFGTVGDRQKRKVADRFPCTNCGHIIGSQAIDLANIKQRAAIDRLQREYPKLKSRLPPRTIHAICTRCGTNFKYLEKDKIFKVERKISTD